MGRVGRCKWENEREGIWVMERKKIIESWRLGVVSWRFLEKGRMELRWFGDDVIRDFG